jgi:putative transposase
MDNVFIERLRRSLKHEDIYLKGYADGRRKAKDGVRSWMEFYNARRLRQALGYRTPMTVWLEGATATRGVDMMDNAAALTTCPQQQQQTTPLAA